MPYIWPNDNLQDLTENYCVDLYIFTNNVCYPVKIKANKRQPSDIGHVHFRQSKLSQYMGKVVVLYRYQKALTYNVKKRYYITYNFILLKILREALNNF